MGLSKNFDENEINEKVLELRKIFFATFDEETNDMDELIQLYLLSKDILVDNTTLTEKKINIYNNNSFVFNAARKIIQTKGITSYNKQIALENLFLSCLRSLRRKRIYSKFN
jgi:hypothetical protein